MRKAPFVAALLLVLASALDAAASVTLTCPPSQNAFVGLQTTVPVTATSSVPGATVTIVSTPVPQGATFTFSSAVTGPPPSSTYLLAWTPSLGQSSASVSFQASDSAGGTSVGSCTVNLTIGQAQIQYVSGIIRDFKVAHSDFGVADGDAGKQLVLSTLGFDGKPVFDTGAGSTTINGAASFNEWFNDVAGTNQSRVQSVTLTNAASIDPDIFTFSSNPWFPIDNDLLGNEGQAHNNYFTYEVHSYLTINPQQVLNFTSSDDLWLFLDGRLVPGWATSNMPGVHGSRSIGLNLNTVATQMGLVTGGVYRFDIFFAHRSSAHQPILKLEINQSALCNAQTAGTTQVSYGNDMSATTRFGQATIDAAANNRLRVVSTALATQGAGWIPTSYPLSRGFSMTFTAQLTKVGAAAADGFAVVLAAAKGLGGPMGYAGLSNSLAIEFDTNQDVANGDPANNHISVHTRGALPNSASETFSIGISPNDPNLPLNFANGSPHQIRIDYTPGDQQPNGWLRVWLNQNLVPTLQVQIADSFWSSISSGGRTFLGFTAGNGGTTNTEIPYIYNVNLVGVPISASLSNLVSPPATIVAGNTGSVLLQLRDACNNKILSGGDGASLAATLTGTATVPTAITDLLDGTYGVSYTPAPTGWGNYNLNVSFSALPIKNSPFLVHANAPDLDGDGFPEDVDNCPGLANPTQADFDNDSLGDACDPDDDGDGVLDVNDAFPLNPNESVDTDHDGIGNNADLDDDGDGQLDVDELACGSNPLLASSLSPDFDNDFIPNCVDTDDDNDGVLDVNDAFPLNPAESVDTDHDGIGNNADLDDDGDGQLDVNEVACGSNPLLASSLSPDLDHDTLPDCVDPDADGDGVLNANDAFPLDASETIDTDHDGIGNNADPDDDNDGALDVNDAFPLNPAESVDTDHDGIGNNADPDDDNDGVLDINDAFPLNPAESVDTDHDGIGNNADPDDDNDGVLDVNDAFPLNPAESVDTDHDGIGNNADPDDDNDGVLDVNDAFPLNPAESVDTDHDGIGNNADPDDDNDGVLDANDAFPLNAAESVDTDHDGIGNNADLDDDGDGQLDTDEIACGSNPLDQNSKSPDYNNNGRPDCVDPPVVTTGYYAMKQAVLNSLIALRPSLSNTAKPKLDFATGRLTRGLAAGLWTDANHLSRFGQRAFFLDSLALHSLMMIRPPVAGVTTQMTALVAIDRSITSQAITEALSASGDSRLIVRAVLERAAGDRSSASGRLDRAVSHYRLAWMLASRAARRIPTLFTPGTEITDTLADLTALLPTATRSDNNKIARAIAEIQGALDTSLWIDASHVSPNRGERAFTRLSNALEALDDVSGQLEAVDNASETITAIARLVAETAVDEAETDGTSARTLDRAQDAIERGDNDTAGRRNAIDYYRQAWGLVN